MPALDCTFIWKSSFTSTTRISWNSNILHHQDFISIPSFNGFSSIVKLFHVKHTVLRNKSLPDIRSTSSSDAKSEIKNCTLNRGKRAFEGFECYFHSKHLYRHSKRIRKSLFFKLKWEKRQPKVVSGWCRLSYHIGYSFLLKENF